MPTDLEIEKMNQSVMDHIILGVAHELNNPNAFIRLNALNLKKMLSLLSPCLNAYEQDHPGEKLGPFTMAELRSKMLRTIDSTLLFVITPHTTSLHTSIARRRASRSVPTNALGVCLATTVSPTSGVTSLLKSLPG